MVSGAVGYWVEGEKRDSLPASQSNCANEMKLFIPLEPGWQRCCRLRTASELRLPAPYMDVLRVAIGQWKRWCSHPNQAIYR